MDVSSWLVPLIFFVFLGAVILVPVYLRSQDRQKFYEAIRVAYERGQPVAPDLVAAMGANAPPDAGIPPVERDLRTGVILLATGLGMGILGFGLWYGLMGVDDLSAYSSGGWTAGIGAIVALVGIVHLGFWLARRGVRARQPRS
jgi:hypothetical protein